MAHTGPRKRSPHIGLELPTEVEYDHGNGVVHPEQAEEDVIPRRHLTGTAASRAITREPEAQPSLVGHQPRATSIERALQKDERRNVDRERVHVVNQGIGGTQAEHTTSHVQAQTDGSTHCN